MTPVKNLVDFGISTVSVQAGEYIDEVIRAEVTPIFQSSTFLLSDDHDQKVLQGKQREINIYTFFSYKSFGNRKWRLIED